MKILALVIVGALAFVGAADAHSWYGDLTVPGTGGARCCGGEDCAPYPYRTDDSETSYEVFILGKWWPVPPERLLDQSSPDTSAHACCYYTDSRGGHQGCQAREPVQFRCVVVPRGSV